MPPALLDRYRARILRLRHLKRGDVGILDLSTGREATLNDGSEVFSLAFSPTGDVVASGTGGGQVYVYDIATGATTTLVDGSPVFALAFNPHRGGLASGDSAGEVISFQPLVWSSSFAKLEHQLCAELRGTGLTRSQWATYAPGQPYQPACG